MVNAPATGQQRVPALAIGVLVLVILYLLVAQLRESPIPEGPASSGAPKSERTVRTPVRAPTPKNLRLAGAEPVFEATRLE